MSEIRKSSYLGDGVYVKDGYYFGEVVIYTSDGITESNHIRLTQTEIKLLTRFYNRSIGEEG